jgi:hypothetical protein
MIGFALLAWPAISAQAQSGTLQEPFFAPAKDSGEHLPANKVYPQGRLFPMTGYGLSAEAAARDGFTMSGRMYHLNEGHLVSAREHGVHVLAGVDGGWSLDELSGGAAAREEIVARIRRRVQEILQWDGEPQIAWWYLRPEELRYWRAGEIEYLEVAAETIRKTDPRRRPVWMYDPGHRNAASLTHTALHLDIVGKGMYVNYSGMMDQRVWCRWTIEQQKAAIAAANPDALPIAVPEMFQHPGRHNAAFLENEETLVPLIRDWVRHDMYAALISGAKGAAVFAVIARPHNDPPFAGRIHRAYYDTYASIARELTGELGLGEVLLFGQQRDDLEVEVTQGPATVILEYRNNAPVVYPTVGHMNVAHGDARYLFLVNSSPHQVEVHIRGLPRAEERYIQCLFAPGDGEPAATKEPDATSLRLALTPWQVRAYRISQAPNER